MFGRKILFLAAWYVAGNVVSTVYNSSKKTTKNKNIKTDPKSLAEKFITTQKNFIADMEDRYVSDDNKEKLLEKKRQFLLAWEKYLEQWEKILAEITSNETYAKSRNRLSDFVSSWMSVVKNSLASKAENSKTKKTTKK